MGTIFDVVSNNKLYQIENLIDDIKRLKDGFHRKLLIHGEHIRRFGSTPENKAIRKIVDQNHSKSINLYNSINKLIHSNQANVDELIVNLDDIDLSEYIFKYTSLLLVYKSIEKT